MERTDRQFSSGHIKSSVFSSGPLSRLVELTAERFERREGERGEVGARDRY